MEDIIAEDEVAVTEIEDGTGRHLVTVEVPSLQEVWHFNRNAVTSDD